MYETVNEAVIVEGVRTPIGVFGKALRDVPAVNLGALVIKDVMRRAGLRPQPSKELLDSSPESLKDGGLTDLEKKYYDWDESLKTVQVDEVIMGHVLQGGQGQNTGRQVAVYGGLPKETPAFTVNKVCASGLKAIVLGAQSIMTGAADVVIGGGMENMSSAPYVLPKARWGYRMDVGCRGEFIDMMVFDGLFEIFSGYHMGMTAENIAGKYGITREEQDELSLMSHQRSRVAIKDGIFKEEIVPVAVPQRWGEPTVFDTDERPMDTSLEKLARLPPAFKRGGTVTAGNASGINDAAAATILMSREKAGQYGVEPMGTIVSFASSALDPRYMGLGPIPAVRKALKLAELTLDDIGLVELNEAFAVQALACMRELGLSVDNTNLHGSGISLGHPIGCTGTRIVVTLLHEMGRRNVEYGLATLCIGGGQGMAIVIRR